jgi:glycine/D-amino acid oxidase-like deaminating enzyme
MRTQAFDPADVVVIGGGILGAATTYWLTQMGVHNVALLEKDGLATGATGRSAGLVRMHYTNEWDAALAFESWKLFSTWSETVGGDCDFRKTGFLMIVGPDSVDSLHRNVAMLRGIGVNTRVLSSEELRDLQPALSLEGVGAAAYEPDSGYADPTSTTTSLARRAADGGARVLQGVAAESIDVQGAAWRASGLLPGGCQPPWSSTPRAPGRRSSRSRSSWSCQFARSGSSRCSFADRRA